MKKYQVLLYYQYVAIETPEQFAKEHLAFCKELNLKGRILVGAEGINGTLSGLTEDTEKYMTLMHEDPRFKEMLFKVDQADQHAFKKMHVRAREEIVSLNLSQDIDPLNLTGDYLSPHEFREALLDDNTVVIDARNDYEFDLGHFRGAIRPDIRNFRELPQWIQEHKEEFMEKRVVTYCTGGIRCEKFSGWLVREGFKDVGQLHGGIATYSRDPEIQGDLWDGMMYVFDERISVPINHVEHTVIAKDWFTGEPCERYVNCANPSCNRQMIASIENEHKYLRGCSSECRKHEQNRYVREEDLTRDDWENRLNKIGESLLVAKN